MHATRPPRPIAWQSYPAYPPGTAGTSCKLLGPMGELVELEAPSKKGAAGPRRKKAPKNGRRPRRSKTALVLGGGGFTGGVYEIGALRALDLLTVNRTVNDFDIYIGTSAGSFVATLVSSGVTPEEMSRIVNKQVPTPFSDVDLGTLLRPNYVDFAARGLLMPLRLIGLARSLAGRWREVSMMDVVTGLAEGLPPGIYSGAGIEKYMKELLSGVDMTDDFRMLEPELYLTATDLDTCERIVFGMAGWDDVPISKAVSASTALPMVYRPVEVKGRQFIDGGIRSTTNVDIAVERGAKFIVVVNPLVPYVNDFQKRIPTIFGSRVRRVSDMGFPQVAYQAFKLLAHARLHEHVKRWGERYPGVDIILIEPDPNDELMFGTSIMNYSSRIEIARHGFESVTLKLAQDYHRYKRICEKHGIEIAARRVTKILRQAEEQREKTTAWRRILEQTTGALLRQSDEQA
jgi:NTE family protein